MLIEKISSSGHEREPTFWSALVTWTIAWGAAAPTGTEDMRELYANGRSGV
jgi:hypothetical protein